MTARTHAAVTQLRLALAQGRADAGRLIASAVAIAIGAAFVVVAFGVTATSDRAVLDAVARQYSSAAVVVGTKSGAPASALPDALSRLRSGGLDGAAVVDRAGNVQIAPAGQAPGSGTTVQVRSISPPGPLRWERLRSGRLPTGPGEAAVSGPSGLSAGDTVSAQAVVYGDVEGRAPLPAHTLRVVGVLAPAGDPMGGTGARLYTTGRQAELLGAVPGQLRLAAGDGASGAATLDRARRLLSAAPATAALRVESGEQVARGITAGFTGDNAGVTAALLVFVALALLVAAMVIANTFAVVLAQRVRELGLLRCVGATVRQVRRSTLVEAAVLGAVSSALGAALGAGLTAAVAALLGDTVPEIPLGTPVIPASALVIAVLAGTTVTVAAALVPTRAATRANPLAALAPLDSAAGAGTSRGRPVLLTVSGLVASVSLIGLLAAAAAGSLPVAVMAGVVNFCAITLLVRGGAARLIALAGRPLGGPGGLPARLAAENVRRHPRRTGATVVVMLIGVTLTSSVLVGSAAARATANRGIGDAYPFDVTVTGGPAPFPADVGARLRGVRGVAAVAPLASARLRAGGKEIDAVGMDPGAVSKVSRVDQAARLPAAGHVAMGYRTADRLGVTDGGVLRLSGDRSGRDLIVSIADVPDLDAGAVALDRAVLDSLSRRTSIGRLWIRLSDGPGSPGTQAELSAIAKIVTAASPGAEIRANVSTRETLDSVLDFLLAVVLGLLAVTVLIAVLGVGNTLALSAIERRRENALIRALGSTRRQLAATVVWEAVQISVVSTVLACGLGIVYGLTGVRATLYDLRVVVPWSQLALLCGGAVLASVAASLVPAWRTTRGALIGRIARG